MLSVEDKIAEQFLDPMQMRYAYNFIKETVQHNNILAFRLDLLGPVWPLSTLFAPEVELVHQSMNIDG